MQNSHMSSMPMANGPIPLPGCPASAHPGMTSSHPGAMTPSHPAGMTPSHSAGMTPSYANMTPQYQPPPLPLTTFEPTLSMYQEPIHPESIPLPYEEPGISCPDTAAIEPVITEVPLNAPIKLPPKWKSSKDAAGRVYFYHVKERISQWVPPQWTEEDARAEAARAVASEMDDDSSSSTESSTETSSEEEDEDDGLDDGTDMSFAAVVS